MVKLENMENKEEKEQVNEEGNEEEKEGKKDKEEEIEEAELSKLEEELKIKEEEMEDLNDSYLRLQADFMNYKKRTEKDKVKTIAYANEDLLCDLLPVIDNFERALENAENEDNSFLEGTKMIYNQLFKVLVDYGLEEIEALGEKFDPNYHHAVLMEESEDDEGTILEVFQKGYKLNEKVIRPSMVKVAK